MASRRLRAAAYCRVSTTMEIQEGSFALQKRYFKERIEADEGLEFVEIYGDFGKSGGNTAKRPEFQRMMKDCEAGKIDVIFCKSVSRFSRNIADLVEITGRLRKLGVAVRFENEGLDTMERNTELLLNILGIIAQEELRSFRENVRVGLEVRHAAGHPTGRVSYGYRCADEDGQWEIEEEEARRVRLAFMLAAGGTCYQDIRRALNDLEEREGTGVSWGRDRIRYLLRNVSYRGDILAGKTYRTQGRKVYSRTNHGEHPRYYIADHHVPIVKTEVFDRVQRLMDLGLLHSMKSHLTEEERKLLADDAWREDAEAP